MKQQRRWTAYSGIEKVGGPDIAPPHAILNLIAPRSYMDRQRRAGLLFVLPAVVYFGGVFLLPLVESGIGSFYPTVPGGLRQFVGTPVYVKGLTHPTLWRAGRDTPSPLLTSGAGT